MSDIIIVFWLAGIVLGIVIFVYSIIFLINVPIHLKRIAKAAERIANALEQQNYE